MDIFQDTETMDIIIDHLNDVFKHHLENGDIKTTNDKLAILDFMKFQILKGIKSGWDDFE